MRIMGIDPSLSGTGMVLTNADDSLYTEKLLSVPIMPGFRHIVKLARRVERFISIWEPDYIFIEAPFVYPGRIQGQIRTLFFHALLREAFVKRHIHFDEFAPKSWKKTFAGNGNADKVAIAKYIHRKSKRKITNDNISDAFAIAKVGIISLGAK
jgi:Holliday junction resolvasome RuvABC endonuclease subunit